jgi:beta-lactamase class A
MSITRREMAAGLALGVSILTHSGIALADDPVTRTLADVERRLSARLGAFILDTGSGREWRHRPTGRFPMCSTFKLLAAGAVLTRVDQGREQLDRHIQFEIADVVSYSPVTKTRAGAGMTLAELCEAALTQSDNTAGNLLLKSIGGPAGLTAFARTLGDSETRLDRWETELNEANPGDPRDTTTPVAMAADLRSLTIGSALSDRSRDQLVAWLVANKTGDAKLRAGLPKDWRVGDKTGGGDQGTMNDIAVIWPTSAKPVIVALYMTETKASFDDRNAAFAKIARTLAAAL